MKLTGRQLETIVELADGDDVFIVPTQDKSGSVSFTRDSDELTGYITPMGQFVRWVDPRS